MQGIKPLTPRSSSGWSWRNDPGRKPRRCCPISRAPIQRSAMGFFDFRLSQSPFGRTGNDSMRILIAAFAALLSSFQLPSSVSGGELFQRYRSNDPAAPHDLCDYRGTQNDLLIAMRGVSPVVPSSLRYFIDPTLMDNTKENYWSTGDAVALSRSPVGRISCRISVSTRLYFASSQMIGVSVKDALARMGIDAIEMSTFVFYNIVVSRSDVLSVEITKILPASVDLPDDKLNTIEQLKSLAASLIDIKRCIQTCQLESAFEEKLVK